MPASTQPFPQPNVAAGQLVGATTAAVATTTGGTIATTSPVAIINPAAAITGVILQQGTVDGQIIFVVNIAAGANSATMAAAGTSFVANGVSTVIAGLTGYAFVWSAPQALWYQIL